jgi:uncharacterized protein
MALRSAMKLVLLVWFGVLSAGAQAGQITVTGQGVVEMAPDMATISLGVTSQARSATSAMSENSAATARVLELLTGAGVEPRDMQTSGLSLSPNWNRRNSSSDAEPQITGYVANNQVTIRVRALDQLGQILDAAIRAGGNTFNGLSFGVQDPGPAADNARQLAVADGLRKANLYAQAANVHLGAIIELSEAEGGTPQPRMLREMAMSDAVPIAGGEVSLSASVTIVVEIVQ